MGFGSDAEKGMFKEYQEQSQRNVKDNWEGRSVGMRCHTCIFFVPKHGANKVSENDARGQCGRCRRHAPTISGFPVVFESDWCGDHKIDENKLER